VSISIFLVPRLGAVMLLGAAVVGQMIGSIIVDHYGLVGYAVREVTPGRAVGVLLLLGGVILIRIY
jgi:bacterial/archaeal transporter family-2 protein